MRQHFLDDIFDFRFSVFRTFLEQAERSKRMTEQELADCRDQLNDSQATILVGLIIQYLIAMNPGFENYTFVMLN
jgi:hypothetical protein